MYILKIPALVLISVSKSFFHEKEDRLSHCSGRYAVHRDFYDMAYP